MSSLIQCKVDSGMTTGLYIINNYQFIVQETIHQDLL